MPSVESAITINVADATSAVPSPTYGEIIVVAEDTSVLNKFNQVKTYYSQSEVETEWGANSPITKTTAKIFAQGVDHLKVVNAVKDDGTGNPLVDYITVLDSLESEQVDYDIIVPTIAADDTDMQTLVDHAGSYKKLIVIPFIGDASAAQTAFSALTANEFCFAIAHDDTNLTVGELAGAVAGVIGLDKPWVPCEWQEIQGINAAGYTPSEVDTLESSNINTVISIARNEISGAKVLTGSFVDVPRTKIYIANEIQTALVNLKLKLAGMGKKIPYSPAGLGMIKAAIERVLRVAQDLGALREDYIDENGNLVRGYVVQMPSWDSISDADKSSRILRNVSVTAYLRGAISKIQLDLVITL